MLEGRRDVCSIIQPEQMNESDCLGDRDPILSGNVNGVLEKPSVGMCTDFCGSK
jgi:hypothetical protein